MLKFETRLVALVVFGLISGSAAATDIGAKKISVKSNVSSRQIILVLSRDPAIDLPTGSDRPTESAATLHVYGAGGLDKCALLTGWEDRGTYFKWNEGKGRIKDDFLKLQLGPRTFSDIPLLTNKNPVNAIFRSGSLVYCMKCTVPATDEDGKYSATNCLATACDPEPNSYCAPGSPSGAFLESALLF
jgi:hypothetical protein